MAFGKFQLQFHFGTEIVALDVDTGVDMVLDVMDKEDQVKQQRRIIIWGVFCTLVTHKLRMVLWDTSVTPNMQSSTERKKLAEIVALKRSYYGTSFGRCKREW